MGESTVNTCLCDLFSVGVSHSVSLANLLMYYPYHLAVPSLMLSDNVNSLIISLSTLSPGADVEHFSFKSCQILAFWDIYVPFALMVGIENCVPQSLGL